MKVLEMNCNTGLIGRFCRALLLVCWATLAVHAADWTVEVVPDVPGGKFSSMKIDSYGNAHVAHGDHDGTLHYSFWDRRLDKWFSTDLTKGGGAFCSLALDSKQHPHISFPAGSGVMHLYWDGAKWQQQFADVHARTINYYTSIALDANDRPIISFYEEFGPGDFSIRLRLLIWNGSYWNLETVDSDPGSGKFNSLALNSRGYPEIAYANVKYENFSLRYARWNGHNWKIDVLQRQDGITQWSVAMVLDSKDIPHIVFTDVVNRIVKYATIHAEKWEMQTVDSINREAYPDRNGIALDDQGDPYVSYYDAGIGVIKVAHRVNGRWEAETVDRGFVGYTSSIKIADDMIYLVYGDEFGSQLRFARRRISPFHETRVPEAKRQKPD
jgi:hypothetical protein